MQSNKAIKIMSFFVSTVMALSLSSCNNISEEDASLVSSNVLESVPESNASNEYLASEVENSGSDSDITEPASNASSVASEVNNTISSQASSKKESSNQSATTNSKCTHPDFWGGATGLHWIGGWKDVTPGIENRYTLTPHTCTENRQVVYKCPVCSEPVLYEEIEPLGHNFSGEEELLTYPSGRSDGSYGYRCQNWNCKETKVSRTISKLTGDYSGIDSCFRISTGDYNRDSYAVGDYLIIFDERTYGSIPTITYDVNTLKGKIETTDVNGASVKYTIYVEQQKLDEGWRYKGIINNDGYNVEYYRIAWNGTAN